MIRRVGPYGPREQAKHHREFGGASSDPPHRKVENMGPSPRGKVQRGALLILPVNSSHASPGPWGDGRAFVSAPSTVAGRQMAS